MNHRDELPLAKVSEVDEAKRQWLQGMRHPVDTVTEPEPAEILAEFIRQHSAAGQLVARAVFLSPPYSVAEEELSVLLESIKQNGDYADIACMTGSQDDYYYSTQAMSETTRRCLCKLWSRTFVAPLHTPFVLSARRILVLTKSPC